MPVSPWTTSNCAYALFIFLFIIAFKNSDLDLIYNSMKLVKWSCIGMLGRTRKVLINYWSTTNSSIWSKDFNSFPSSEARSSVVLAGFLKTPCLVASHFSREHCIARKITYSNTLWIREPLIWLLQCQLQNAATGKFNSYLACKMGYTSLLSQQFGFCLQNNTF